MLQVQEASHENIKSITIKVKNKKKQVNHEKYENTDLGVKIKLYIIYILCIMYWRDWSYRKRKLSSELEQLLTEP